MPTTIINPASYEEWLNNFAMYGITKELIENAQISTDQLPMLYAQVKKLKNSNVEKSWQLKMLNGETIHYRPEFGSGAKFAHFAAQCGNLGTLQWLHSQEQYSIFLKEKNNGGESIIHFAAQADSKEILLWLQKQEQYANLLTKESGWFFNIAHYAAESGSAETLQWIYEQYPDLLSKKIEFGDNIAHRAASSGNLAALKWIHNHAQYKSMLEIAQFTNINLAHNAARSGSRESLQWIKEEYPLYWKRKIVKAVLSFIMRLKPAVKRLYNGFCRNTRF